MDLNRLGRTGYKELKGLYEIHPASKEDMDFIRNDPSNFLAWWGSKETQYLLTALKQELDKINGQALHSETIEELRYAQGLGNGLKSVKYKVDKLGNLAKKII